MKCPQCSSWTSVLSTRGTRRRRECGNAHRFFTVEVEATNFEYMMKERRYRMAQSRLRAMGYLK